MLSPFIINCAQPDDVSQRRLGTSYSRAETAEVRFVEIPSNISIVSPPDVLQAGDNSNSDTTDAPSVEVPSRIDEWSRETEKQFQVLAHLYALGTLPADQQKEFARLQAARRIYHHPLPFEQIAFEYKRSSLLEEIQKALDRYVQFISLPR